MVFRYVTHARVQSYIDAGWIDCGPVAGHHGAYARLMKWLGEGEPIEP